MIKVTDKATHLHTHCSRSQRSQSRSRSRPSPAQLQPGQTLCLCWHAEPAVWADLIRCQIADCVCLQIQIPHRQVSYMHPAWAPVYPCSRPSWLAGQQCLVNWRQLSEKCLRQRVTHIPTSAVRSGWPPSDWESDILEWNLQVIKCVYFIAVSHRVNHIKLNNQKFDSIPCSTRGKETSVQSIE